MVGSNHEMGRELLWRGYPTDQRGTYFAQFWDTSRRRVAAADMLPMPTGATRRPRSPTRRAAIASASCC